MWWWCRKWQVRREPTSREASWFSEVEAALRKIRLCRYLCCTDVSLGSGQLFENLRRVRIVGISFIDDQEIPMILRLCPFQAGPNQLHRSCEHDLELCRPCEYRPFWPYQGSLDIGAGSFRSTNSKGYRFQWIKSVNEALLAVRLE